MDFRSRFDFVKDFSELGSFLYEPVRIYSSGMRARLAFAISMVIDFDCYLIDEVMAVGDAQFKARSKEVMSERLKTANVIMTSHNMADIRQYCGVVVHVDGGRVSVYDDIEQGIRAYQGTPAKA